MRSAGLAVDGQVGDQDPIAAVHEAWDPTQYDEVVVSTLPTGTSRWLQVDLPHRIERLTGVRVTHVVASPKRAAPQAQPAHKPEKTGRALALRGHHRPAAGRRPAGLAATAAVNS